MFPAYVTGSPLRYHASFWAVSTGSGVGREFACPYAWFATEITIATVKTSQAGLFIAHSPVVRCYQAACQIYVALFLQ